MPRTKKTETNEVSVTNATNATNATNTVSENTTPTFTPEVIIASERFRQYADLIAAVIEDREYSIEEVEDLLQETLTKPIVEVFND